MTLPRSVADVLDRHVTFEIASIDRMYLNVYQPRLQYPSTHRYRVTDTGLHHAMFLTRVHNRLLRTGTAQLADPNPPAPTPLRAAIRAYDTALDELTRQAGLAA